MQLPEELQAAIEQIAQHSPALKKARETLTQAYREGQVSRFSDEAIRLAYLGARMPATYAAIHKVLAPLSLEGHLLDLGAGPGTASWAAATLFPHLQQITLIEKSPEAIALGKTLMQASSDPLLAKAQWLQQTLADPIPSADAAILSYVLNEVPEASLLIEKCWEAVSLLILIEPGTPKGFQLIRKARDLLIGLKAHILAPCPHAYACPMQGTDWCHFAARVERTRLHRLLKGGSLGYEDEKFSYLVVSKKPGIPFYGRVVRAPLKGSGFVRLPLCARSGKLEEKVIVRKQKEIYRKARDLAWGDALPLDAQVEE